MKKLAFLFLLIPALCGCSEITAADMEGVYRAVYPYGVETILLNGDGSFRQTWTPKMGSQLFSAGRWQIDRNGKHQVSFSNVYYVNDICGGFNVSTEAGNCTLPINTNAGRISIIVDKNGGRLQKLD